MHRCLVKKEELTADRIALGHEESRHLQTVLRVKTGDTVELFDGEGKTRRVTVVSASRKGLDFAPAEPPRVHPRLPVSVTLFASVIKRMDWTVEKATELGADCIVPVITERSVVRIGKADGPSKAERWMRIAEESVRQCDAAWMPSILPPVTFAESLPLVRACAPTFVAALSPDARPLRTVLTENGTTPRVGFYAGPEGDFTPAELDALRDAGAVFVNLGPRILRAETACLYGLALLSGFFFTE